MDPTTPAFDKTQTDTVAALVKRLLERDTLLTPYAPILERRLSRVLALEKNLAGPQGRLADIAGEYDYFGLHREQDIWVFREWAPNATAIFLIGETNGWQPSKDFALARVSENGLWELRLTGNTLSHGQLFRLLVQWEGGQGDRIPSYARRVVQDPHTLIFNAQVWEAPAYEWRHEPPDLGSQPALIYEAHVGMAQQEGEVGTFAAFTEKVLPRIIDSGYNTLQLMAIQEHPYYGSFGYHVSNFFAASSRFGTPEDLKRLVDTAHGAGLRVIMDIVHSHAVSNEVEGLSRFDGTLHQYFHDGPRGLHTAWDSRCFDYGKEPVLRFLLSNCRFWLEEYRFDGFRFDGITSMLYLDHGLEKAFTGYDDYFNHNVDEEALAYLTLANRVIHQVRPDAITIAEDISGMPGLATPIEAGGIGFDFRLAMGIPDHWIRLVKDYADEAWPMGHLWYELNNRRYDEKSISYAESHDQALVGDQTLMFRMAGAAMYHHMCVGDPDTTVDRAMALHKMMRFITLTTAGHGYQSFMGNEFGHPEWIDFPRPGNAWSYHYARRQWHLADDPALKYRFLLAFDREMIALVRRFSVLDDPWPYLLYEHNDDKILAFSRAGLVFVFNFHPTRSYTDYAIHAPAGKYTMILNSDDAAFGGHHRLAPDQEHLTLPMPNTKTAHRLFLYLPTRTALVLKADKA